MANNNDVNNSNDILKSTPVVSKYSGLQMLVGTTPESIPPPPSGKNSNDNSLRSQGITTAMRQLNTMYELQETMANNLHSSQQKVLKDQEALFTVQKELHALTQLLQMLMNSNTKEAIVELIVALISKKANDEDYQGKGSPPLSYSQLFQSLNQLTS